MKIPTKVFLTSDTIRVLDDRARRTKRQKSEIVRAAVEAYLSPDSVEAGEAALFRRLDRMSRQLDRLERDVTIANEAIGLFVKTWLKVTPAMSSVEDGETKDGSEEPLFDSTASPAEPPSSNYKKDLEKSLKGKQPLRAK